MILAVIDCQHGNDTHVIPGSISEGSMDVAFKPVLQRQGITAEVHEQSVLKKMHDHSAWRWNRRGTNG